jgi:putative exporter of polyketide antibiotics
MGRVWLIALAVLLVGILEREAGLAAAVLSAALFSCYLAGQGLAHLVAREGSR